MIETNNIDIRLKVYYFKFADIRLFGCVFHHERPYKTDEQKDLSNSSSGAQLMPNILTYSTTRFIFNHWNNCNCISILQ